MFRYRFDPAWFCKCVLVSTALMLAPGRASADATKNIYDAICLKPDPSDKDKKVRVARASAQDFLIAFHNEFAVPYPGELFVPAPNPPPNGQESCTVPPSRQTGFVERARSCGFENAVNAGFAGAYLVANGSENDKALCPPSVSGCSVFFQAYEQLDTYLSPAGTGPDGVSTRQMSSPVSEELLKKYPSTFFIVTSENPHSQNLAWDVLNSAVDFEVQCAPERKYIFAMGVPELLKDQPIIVAKEPADALLLQTGDKTQKEKAKPFEVGLSFDREKRTVIASDTPGVPDRSEYNDVVTVDGTVATKLGVLPIDSNLAFLQLSYKSDFDPTKEVDDLSFGVTGDWSGLIFGQEASWLDSLNGTVKWITDVEERDSAVWKVSASSLLNIPWVSRWKATEGEAAFLYDTTAVIDYIHAVHIGDKQSLAAVGETFRAGYDVRWQLKYGYFIDLPWEPALSGTYQYRDTLGSGAGNADLITIDLELLAPEKTFGPGLVLQYKRGENIDTLQPMELYGLKFTLK